MGYFIGITNCAAPLEFGLPDRVIMKAITSSQDNQKEVQGTIAPLPNDSMLHDKFKLAVKLQNKTLSIVLYRIGDPHVLPLFHCVLVWTFHISKYLGALELIHDDFPWELLSNMLNMLLRSCRNFN